MNLKKIMLMFIFVISLFAVSGQAGATELTAYTHTGSPMANGEWPYEGAVASNDYALGTILNINGYNYVVADRMAPGIHGVIDIFMNDYNRAVRFGRQYGEVYVVA